MTWEREQSISNLIVTVTTLIFAVTSMITVYISLSAWRDEREAVRPYLTFQGSPKVYFQNSNQLEFSFRFINVGQHPTGNLHCQTLIVNSKLDCQPLHTDQYSMVNYIPQNTTADLVIKIDIEAAGLNTEEIKEHYIVINLKYADPVLEKQHEQIIYLKWAGIIDGIPTPIFHASKEDKTKIVNYLKKL